MGQTLQVVCSWGRTRSLLWPENRPRECDLRAQASAVEQGKADRGKVAAATQARPFCSQGTDRGRTSYAEKCRQRRNNREGRQKLIIAQRVRAIVKKDGARPVGARRALRRGACLYLAVAIFGAQALLILMSAAVALARQPEMVGEPAKP